MKAIRVYEYGSPEVLRLEDIADPVAGAGEVLIDVAGAGVNPIDWKVLSGAMKAFIPLPLPFTPGIDVAGTVVAIGDGVTQFKVGDEVFGFINIVGGYATKAVAQVSKLALKPRTLSALHASAVPATALTAWQALTEHASVQPRQKVLIHAAAGGVGSMAVQIAKYLGAEVYATASAQNHAYLKDLGADYTIDYTAQAFEEQVPKVDVVLDLVGGETQVRSFAVLKKHGVLVSPVSLPSMTLANDHGVTPVNFATRSDGRQLALIAELFDKGHLSVTVEAYALSEAKVAIEKSIGRHARGKLVLDTTQ
ncbi:NADP-dependent oxidoreductase [Pseudomonas costantinii]|uniref:NADPH:quinone reductase n=1 Tax=Pseudomonas costantinii TaxID=168469 RepID=A0A1S2UPU0_9PSED|nr:NADP-dependent oxidoreductase [Pseudomonas costantinii]NVZ23720.1 NADP-dependent oxidoreductase [Pseudomonas costantinii]OIN48394.1 oxidoreductase [Pseudomonas costantinii]SED53672.1 NADPH:quinone reductase [Pseudomonas costantinii]